MLISNRKKERKKERVEGIVCYLDDVLSSVIAAMGLRLTMVSLWHTPWALSPWHWSTLAHRQLIQFKLPTLLICYFISVPIPKSQLYKTLLTKTTTSLSEESFCFPNFFFGQITFLVLVISSISIFISSIFYIYYYPMQSSPFL